jgi:phosphocarrier protein
VTGVAAVEITNATGLHARPAVKLTKLAKSFADAATQVALAEAGPWIDAKSVVKVMAMKAPRGAFLYVRASGADADAARAAIVALVRRDFDEGHGPAADAPG